MFDWLSFFSSSSAAIPLIVALVLWRRLDNPMRILAGMFLAACLIELGCWYLAFNHTSNLWLGHIWTAVEYTCLILIFAYWQKRRTVQRLLRLSVPVFYAILILNKIFLESFDELDSVSRPICSVVIICVAAFAFQRLIIEPGESLVRDPRFWVCCATLIYHAGTLTLFTLGRGMMEENMANFDAIYTVHSVINILTNLLYAGGFLCRRQR